MKYPIIRLLTGIVSAFASAMVTAFLSGFIVGLIISYQDSTQNYYGENFAFFFAVTTTWGSSIFLTPAILILSVPLHRLAIRLGRVRGRDYAVAGALVGMGVYLAVQLAGRMKLLGLEFPGQMAIPALVIAPLLGTVAALGLWTVTRPDKAVPGQGG